MIKRRFWPTKIQKEYQGKAAFLVNAVEIHVFAQRTRPTFERPNYTEADVAHLCDWLNEREAGYPAEVRLK